MDPALITVLGVIATAIIGGFGTLWKQNRDQTIALTALTKSEAVCHEKLDRVLSEKQKVADELRIYREQQERLHGENREMLKENAADLSAIKEKIVNGGGGPDLKAIDRHVKAQGEQLAAVIAALRRAGFDKDGNPLPKPDTNDTP